MRIQSNTYRIQTLEHPLRTYVGYCYNKCWLVMTSVCAVAVKCTLSLIRHVWFAAGEYPRPHASASWLGGRAYTRDCCLVLLGAPVRRRRGFSACLVARWLHLRYPFCASPLAGLHSLVLEAERSCFRLSVPWTTSAMPVFPDVQSCGLVLGTFRAALASSFLLAQRGRICVFRSMDGSHWKIYPLKFP